MKPFSLLAAALSMLVLAPITAGASTLDNADTTMIDNPLTCDDKGLCSTNGRVTEKNSGKVLSTIVIYANKDTKTQGVLIVTPLGTALEPGVRIGIGDTDSDFPFQTCLPVGCRALTDMPVDQFKSLLQQEFITIQFFPFTQEQPIAFRYELGETLNRFREGMPGRADLFD